jgi:hypothetical protein
MAFIKPYKTVEDVKKAIDNLEQKEPERVNEVLAKMSPQLCKDEQAMLKLIETTEQAYVYAHQQIKTDEFKEQALRDNPSVYRLLSDEDRQNERINGAYLEGMCDNMKKVQIFFQRIFSK